jgi:oxaloacetate decarboxylase gamma subunit
MESIDNGLLLLVIGMGTVFVFLSIMVIAIEVSSRVCARYAHLIPETSAGKTQKKRPPKAKEDDGILLAVVTAAVHRYRREHGQ